MCCIVRKAVLGMVAMKRLTGHALPGVSQLASDITQYKQDAEKVRTHTHFTFSSLSSSIPLHLYLRHHRR